MPNPDNYAGWGGFVNPFGDGGFGNLKPDDWAKMFEPPPSKPPTPADKAVEIVRVLEAENEKMRGALATCIVNLERWEKGEPEAVSREYFGVLAGICEEAMPAGFTAVEVEQ